MLKINKLLPLLILLVPGCDILKNNFDYDAIPDGMYHSGNSKGRVYIENRGDSLLVYKLDKYNGKYIADSNGSSVKNYLYKTSEKGKSCFFNSPSFDFDALTIPFKYRPETSSLPQQFTTSLNGAIYLGIRNDGYKLRYKKHFFNYYKRTSRHYAISLGGFTGFGSTAMNPWVTDYNISSEYEGVVWSKGAAVIMAVGKYTSGFSIGWDNLLDKNHKFWIYEKKPWIGLVFGFNLN